VCQLDPERDLLRVDQVRDAPDGGDVLVVPDARVLQVDIKKSAAYVVRKSWKMQGF
jgi:hypothetical protein